jgi:two-component system chemotaxis response regulator CheB
MEGVRQKDEIRHALGPDVQAPGEVPAAAVPAELEAEPLRVMIVDDSRLIRKIVQEILEADPALRVVGYAANGREALSKIDELQPDLILLDWDMPVMMGGTTLMHIMIRSPCPVVILSGFVGGAGASSFDLLCLGAVDFLRKPQSKWRTDGRADDMVRRIKQAGGIRFERIRRIKIPVPLKGAGGGSLTEEKSSFLCVMAASTGGCTDLIRIIPGLPGDFPSAVVVLHDMQPEALGPFTEYLAARSRILVKPVEEGVPLLSGVCYIHPATVPLELVESGEGPVLKVPPEHPESLPVDHILVSASEIMGSDLLAVVLSGDAGMGMEGFRAVKKSEGITVALDPAAGVDPGMAEALLAAGLVDRTCSPDELAAAMKELVEQAYNGNKTP